MKYLNPTLAGRTALLSLVLLLSAQGFAQGTDNQLPELKPITAQEVISLVEAHDGPVLLNIWASWCRPCTEEMPDLLRLYNERKSRGFKLLLVSADFLRQRGQAASYLGSLGVNFESYIKNQVDDEFINQIDPSWSGALPFSVLFKADGSVAKTWDGKLTFDEVNELLDRDK